MKIERKPHKIMTQVEYAATPFEGWHEICRNIDDFGGVGIRYLGDENHDKVDLFSNDLHSDPRMRIGLKEIKEQIKDWKQPLPSTVGEGNSKVQE